MTIIIITKEANITQINCMSLVMGHRCQKWRQALFINLLHACVCLVTTIHTQGQYNVFPAETVQLKNILISQE